jgi:hypothetical protein
MVKKLMTGLAISVGAGAGLAIAVSTRAPKQRPHCHPATNEGTMTPVSIRVHPAINKNEQGRLDIARTLDDGPANTKRPGEAEEPATLEASPERSAELAEIRVMIETLDQRTTEMISTVNQRIDDLQNHLPRFIDVKVTSRIREVEERLRTEFQDEQSRTLDAFLKTLDQKVLPRISTLEETVGSQDAQIRSLRQHIEKTDVSLERVLDRIEKVFSSISASSHPGHANPYVMEIHQKAVA